MFFWSRDGQPWRKGKKSKMCPVKKTVTEGQWGTRAGRADCVPRPAWPPAPPSGTAPAGADSRPDRLNTAGAGPPHSCCSRQPAASCSRAPSGPQRAGAALLVSGQAGLRLLPPSHRPTSADSSLHPAVHGPRCLCLSRGKAGRGWGVPPPGGSHEGAKWSQAGGVLGQASHAQPAWGHQPP